MKSKTGLLLLFALIFCFAYGQANPITPLKVGDAVPALLFTDLLNVPSGKIDFNDYSNKLVILDFWNRGCAPCIKAIPKMQKLQDEFNGQLQVILVTENTREQLRDVLQNSSILRANKLPGIISDTILWKLFPHPFEPFHVWINKGKVIALTSGHNATSDNVKDIINGRAVYMATFRNRDDMNLSRYTSLFQPRNSNLLQNIKSHSVLTGPLFVGAFGEPLSDSISHRIIGTRFIDYPRMPLFRQAYEFTELSLDRIILNVTDKTQFKEVGIDTCTDEWFSKNIFTYEMVAPILKNMPNDEKKDAIILKIMQQDLERFFGIKGTVEMRTMNCWVLTRTEAKTNFSTKGGYSEEKATADKIILRNANFLWLRDELMRQNLGKSGVPPIIDETNCDFCPVDIEINGPFADRVKLSQELKKYGLDLIEAKRDIKVLVLTEINK